MLYSGRLKLFSCIAHSCTYLIGYIVECVALSDKERNENCQQLLASDDDSDDKISPLEVCQRRF